MKAVVIKEPGGPEVLQIQDFPDPVPQAGEVLIDVKAAGVNRSDIFQRKGNYPPPPGVVSDIPGLEVAGIVSDLGQGSQRWKIGDRVCALVSGGGYASTIAVDERHCLPLPVKVSFIEGAALPEGLFTIWHNVFQRGRLQPGESLLVHGGSGGVGCIAIKLATVLGSRVYATASNEFKCKACMDWGASACFNYHKEDFATILKNDGVDVILDMVGGDYIGKNLSILRPDGRLVFINAMKGPNGVFNVFDIMQRRLTITGSTLRPRSALFKAELAGEIENRIWPLVAERKILPHISATFSLKNAAHAHQFMENGKHIGKIVLDLDSD
jgi:NADPH2:quinone reductase